MAEMHQTIRNLVKPLLQVLLALPFLLYALSVNGSLPGILTPTLGQGAWLVGFAKSLADATMISPYSHSLGLPQPAGIALGLPGVIVAILGLKLGLPAPDAYAFASLFWLSIAFWGAIALTKHFGGTVFIGILGATVWLTFPVVWQHAGYSAVAFGIALLPAYIYTTIKFINSENFSLKLLLLLIAACLISSFMDGYSFMMYFSFSIGYISLKFLADAKSISIMELSKFLSVILAFITSAFIYLSYIPSDSFVEDISIFRSFGLDIHFILFPHERLSWLADLLNLSVKRDSAHLFGDGSVFVTTFMIVPILTAVALLLTPYGKKRQKFFLFLIGFIALYLALGPSFKFNSYKPEGLSRGMPPEYALGPTGTALIWEHVPGLNNMRAVYRWAALALAAFWVVIMIAVADRRLPKSVGISILSALLLVNFPHLGKLWGNYAKIRTTFFQMDSDIRALSGSFLKNELVAFLPAGNDFIMNYLAPNVGIRTFNIGGDKNAIIAQSHWPESLKVANAAKSPEDFVTAVRKVLDGTADAVALPYMHLFWAAMRWPYPADRKEEMADHVRVASLSGAFEITETPYFAILRLKDDARGISDKTFRAQLLKVNCSTNMNNQSMRVLNIDTPVLFSNKLDCASGWSMGEPWGRWTEGQVARLNYSLPQMTGKYVLEFTTRGFIPPKLQKQRIGVSVNGQQVAHWVFDSKTPMQLQRVPIPTGAKNLDIEFLIPDAISPKQIGLSGDSRSLGLGVTAVCLTLSESSCLSN